MVNLFKGIREVVVFYSDTVDGSEILNNHLGWC